MASAIETDVNIEYPLPLCVRKRLLAILKLQQELIDTDAEFHRRLFELEREFNEKRQTIYAKRAEIIKGEYEPMEKDLNIDFLPPEVVRSTVKATQDDDVSATIKGIPNFWREALNNSAMSGTFDCDRSALQYLNDIQLEISSEPDLMFRITFKFDSNPYFENESLTKVYYVECSVDSNEPFAYDGAQIYKSIGCEINWRDDMNYTKDQSSFFHFFTPPPTDIEDEIDPNRFEDITTDFEMGLFLKEKMIPKAVLYFLSNEFESENSSGDSSASEDIANEELIENEGII